MSHLHKPRTIPRRPRLRLRRMQEFSDLALISKEGKAVHCHRCVLVARSGVCVCVSELLGGNFKRSFSCLQNIFGVCC